MAESQSKLSGSKQVCNRYNFKADWRDLENCHTTEFILSYFLNDGAIELFDVKKRRVFLKKRAVPGVTLKDLYVGNTVNIMSRQINILDYGDDCTKTQMQIQMQQTFGLIKPELFEKLGVFMDIIMQENFLIGQLRTIQLNNDQGTELLSICNGSDDLSLQQITSGPLIALELRGQNAIKRWIELVGPSDPEEARKICPSSLRAQFGRDKLRNGFYCAQNECEVNKLTKFVFNSHEVGSTAKFTGSTCCIIKPHAVQAGVAGKIISDIQQAGYKVTAAKLIILDIPAAEEFLEIYRGLLPEYSAMVMQLSNGPCIALEVTGRGPDTPKEFREFTGPADPEVARKLRPNTLRAKYGKDKVANGIHCTDLPDDAPLEVEYFFKLL